MYWCRGADLQAWRAPRSAWRVRGSPRRCVENDDPEPATVERRTGTGDERAMEQVGVVRDEHNREITVLAPHIVDQSQRRHLAAWAEHLIGGLQECADLGVAIGLALHGVAVESERDIVEEHSAIYVRHVDPPLDPVGER